MSRDFNAWLSGFRDSIADYGYYIDFEKVHRNVDNIKVELNIKEQHNCKATGYWKTNSVKYNFLLIAHEYLFVLKK